MIFAILPKKTLSGQAGRQLLARLSRRCKVDVAFATAIEDVDPKPEDGVVFGCWTLGEIERQLEGLTEARSPFALWAISTDSVSPKQIVICNRARITTTRDSASLRRIVGAGISNAWIGFDPLLLSIGSGEPRARVGILAVARDDAEETIIGKAAGILAEVRNTTFAFVAAGSEWNQGTVNTARAGGVKRIKMLTRLRDGQETVQGAEAVLALCPEAVYLARRHGKSVIVPPVWEAWRAAYDLCPESICEDWEVAKNLIREGAWPACPSPKNAIKLGQHTAEKMLLILGGADHER